MGNLSNIQIGSIVLNMVENIPDSLSGATLWNMVDNEVYNAENITGQTISTTSIGQQYQPAIISLTASAVLRMMELLGADVSSIRLGDFSVNKGGSSSILSSADRLRDDGIRKLNALGTEINYYKALG